MTLQQALALLRSKLEHRRFLNRDDEMRRRFCQSKPPQALNLTFREIEALITLLCALQESQEPGRSSQAASGVRLSTDGPAVTASSVPNEADFGTTNAPAALGIAGEPAPPARLMTLARIGAATLHNYYFDRAENIDDDPPDGHVNDGTGERGTRNMFGFDSCPHPDCVLVRESAALAASPGPVQTPNDDE